MQENPGGRLTLPSPEDASHTDERSQGWWWARVFEHFWRISGNGMTEYVSVCSFRGEHLWVLSCYNITFRWVIDRVFSNSFLMPCLKSCLLPIRPSHVFFRYSQVLQCGGVSLQAHVSQGVFTTFRNSRWHHYGLGHSTSRYFFTSVLLDMASQA